MLKCFKANSIQLNKLLLRRNQKERLPDRARCNNEYGVCTPSCMTGRWHLYDRIHFERIFGSAIENPDTKIYSAFCCKSTVLRSLAHQLRHGCSYKK